MDNDPPIRLHNTRTHQPEPLETIEEGKVRLYVCGISVSGPPHVGHGRSYVLFDVLRRVLEHAGYEVHHVQNFTDIEEPIVKRAQARGLEPLEYAEQMIDAYFEAMDQLAVKHADHFPRVTEYIDRIIEATETLEDHKCAYPIDDGIAFRVCDIEGFGQLLGRDPTEAVVHDVPEAAWNGRENPFDFILWRNDDDLGVLYETPWGEGRPGWHTECAVMATDLLGETIDIHGGGLDLIFPHHECESAIAQCLTGQRFVNHWVHNGLVTLEEEKMSKSLRNIVSLADAVETHSPATVRTAYLLAPYRQTLEWSTSLTDEARNDVKLLEQGLAMAAAGDPSETVTELRERFITHLRDDLGTPEAVATLRTLATEHAQEPGAFGVIKEGLELLGLAELEPFASRLETEGAG